MVNEQAPPQDEERKHAGEQHQRASKHLVGGGVLWWTGGRVGLERLQTPWKVSRQVCGDIKEAADEKGQITDAVSSEQAGGADHKRCRQGAGRRAAAVLNVALTT